MMAFQSWTSDR